MPASTLFNTGRDLSRGSGRPRRAASSALLTGNTLQSEVPGPCLPGMLQNSTAYAQIGVMEQNMQKCIFAALYDLYIGLV